MDTASTHESIIRRAAEHMIHQHGRHAADFADYRSRELRALGNVEAADLWTAVGQRARETLSASPAHALEAVP